MSLLVTGATGFLGSYLVARLLAAGEDVVALVRGPDAQERLDAACGPGAVAFEGDLRGPLPALPADIDRVVHCAASVAFTLPLDEARATNVEGTRRLLEACSPLPRLERFVHVSTAYVCGRLAGDFGERDRGGSGAFRNTYEHTKHEAEAVVRDSGLPVSIVRPSIVVGDSASGWTSSFNVLYPPLQAFARGLVTEVPADPDGIVDVVPVDHVADVIEAALEHGSPVLHAVAAEHAVTTRTVAALASEAFDRPPPRFTPAATGTGLEVYFPYFSVAARFRADAARELGLAPPPLASYFDVLLEYAAATRWGRRRAPAPAPAPAPAA